MVLGWLGDIFNPPDAPDPDKIITAQTSADQDAARFNAEINRTNSYTPSGSVTWGRDGDVWSSYQTFSPQMQNIYDQSMNYTGGLYGLSNSRLNQMPYNSMAWPHTRAVLALVGCRA
jgi:hypothetical protein